MVELFLGLDVGTSGARALLIDGDGKVAASATESYPLATPQPGWAEQDPLDWYRGSVTAIRRALEMVTGASVRAVGLTGQMHSTVFLDGQDRPLRAAILWCDQRTAAQCDEITARAGGLPGLLRLTSNRALPGFTAPTILWVRQREPELFSSVRSILVGKDYVRYRLTGERVSDVSDASGTLLLDVRRRCLSEELLARLDLERSLLFEVVESAVVSGTITPQAARETGLAPGTPVVGGAGDQAAAAVGCGIIRDGIASISIGTSGVVFAATSRPLEDEHGSLHVFCHAAPDLWHAMGVTLSAGGSVRWWRDVLAPAGGLGYPELDEEAQRVEPGASGLLFLPYLSGERTPVHDARARGVFFGLSLAHGRGHMMRAVLEGVCLALRSNLDLLHARGQAPSEIRLTGGGARSPLFRRILAEVLECPLSTLEVDEGPALGAALLAAVGVGAVADLGEACGRCVHVADRVVPSGSAAPAYREARARFQELYERVKGLWPR
ncbi:MAG: xylulokinase [Planctomycetota bacterium]